MKTLLRLLFYVVIIEVFLRFGLKVAKDYSFWKPRFTTFEKDLEAINNLNPDSFNVLVLGGSAVSNALPAKIGEQLQDSLSKTYENVTVVDIGMPARTSKDNLVCLQLAKPEKIALVNEVYYYESLNDSRYNCIPAESFKEDYSHAHWYQELALMQKHTEMNITIIPFVADLFMQRLKERTGSVEMLNDELDVKPEFMDFGAKILTSKTFEKNVSEILALFDLNKTKVYLLGYHVFVPEPMMKKENLGFWNEEKYFNAQGPRTTSGAWGYPWNAVKALEVHNGILQNLATEDKKLTYHDMKGTLSAVEKETFFDMCHFTQEGGSAFVSDLMKLRKGLAE